MFHTARSSTKGLIQALAFCLVIFIGIESTGRAAAISSTSAKGSLATPTPANLWLLDPRIFNWPTEPVKVKPSPKKLSTFVELKPGVSDSFINEISAAMDNLPSNAMQVLSQNGYKITLAPTITDAVPAAKQEQVRGYEDNSSWNSVYGMFNRTSRRIVMAELAEHHFAEGSVQHQRLADRQRRIGILKHEFGHAVDHYLGNISHTKKFADAYHSGLKTVSLPEQGVLKYYLQPGLAGTEETFAELFACLSGPACDARSDILLKNHFGALSTLIQQQIASMH